jgi:hypothetical protein
MAAVGERRLRELSAPPGTRVWVEQPSAMLCCSLCDEVFGRVPEEREPLTLPCGHSFCRGCLARWYSAPGKLCPNCRSPTLLAGITCVRARPD